MDLRHGPRAGRRPALYGELLGDGIDIPGGHLAWDGIVVEGKSEKPVWINIADDNPGQFGSRSDWVLLTENKALLERPELADYASEKIWAPFGMEADAIWSEEEGRLLLYFHGENPVTRVASSRDGAEQRSHHLGRARHGLGDLPGELLEFLIHDPDQAPVTFQRGVQPRRQGRSQLVPAAGFPPAIGLVPALGQPQRTALSGQGQPVRQPWLALPFTNPTTGDPPTGDQSWTCFLSAANFKGPIAYYIPETWSKIGKLFNYPFIYGRGLDARPLVLLGGTAARAAVAAFLVFCNRHLELVEAGAAEPGYAFTGREWDPEIGLAFYRARYYAPAVGRFLSEDPLGSRRGLRRYPYVENQPVRFIDPFGYEESAFQFLLRVDKIALAAMESIFPKCQKLTKPSRRMNHRSREDRFPAS